jgi:hypothetical protein
MDTWVYPWDEASAMSCRRWDESTAFSVFVELCSSVLAGSFMELGLSRYLA